MTQSTRPARMLRIAILTLAAIIFASTLGAFHWIGDLLATFSEYWIVLLLIAAALAAWRQAWLVAGVGLLFCLVGAIDLVSFRSVQLSAEQPTSIRLMVQNVYFDNEEVDALMQEIERLDPDLIYLMEYPSDANPVMRLDLDQTYPYQLIEPSRFTMGTAFYSKYPIDSAVVHQFAETRIPIFEIEVTIEGRSMIFVGGHPWPPLPQWGQRHRDQLADIIEVATAVDQIESPLIVAGDFNTVPHSHMLNRLALDANVAQVRNRFDLRKTFVFGPVVRFSFDHIFVSDQVAVTHYEFGDPAGSDHRSVLIDFSIPEADLSTE